MAPENLRVMIEEGDGRWGPPFKNMYDSKFWKRPVFQHWRGMLERGRQFPAPGTMNPAPGGELAAYVIGRVIHPGLVGKWNVEKAVVGADQKGQGSHGRNMGA